MSHGHVMCVRVCVPEIMLNCMSCEALPASNCWCVYKRVSVCVRACACACVCKCSLSIRSVEHASMDLCRRILLAQAFCQTSCRQLGGSCALLPVLVVGPVTCVQLKAIRLTVDAGIRDFDVPLATLSPLHLEICFHRFTGPEKELGCVTHARHPKSVQLCMDVFESLCLSLSLSLSLYVRQNTDRGRGGWGREKELKAVTPSDNTSSLDSIDRASTSTRSSAKLCWTRASQPRS